MSPSSSGCSPGGGRRESSGGTPSAASTPSASGYSNVSSAKYSCASFEQEGDEAPRVLLPAGARQHARRAGDHQAADVAGVELVVAARQAGVLLEEPVVVVVVDQPERDLAAADGLHDRVVVRVRRRVVGGHPLQPRTGGGLALELPHRRHEVLEPAVGRRDADLAVVRGRGQVQDRAGAGPPRPPSPRCTPARAGGRSRRPSGPRRPRRWAPPSSEAARGAAPAGCDRRGTRSRRGSGPSRRRRGSGRPRSRSAGRGRSCRRSGRRSGCRSPARTPPAAARPGSRCGPCRPSARRVRRRTRPWPPCR